ncbi:MAG TPA: arginase family protein [Anaerolineales bacterium]|jgi:arginase|nr:arginase family protein [Anaerolineales bacterium]
MKVRIIQIPYDSGNRNLRMGRGPEHLIENGLPQALQAEGHEVSMETIETPAEFRAEVQTQFALYRSLATNVDSAKQDDQFPLVLSGNCGATVGVIAGARTKRLGVIWFDAHGEFNTPETTTSGFLDGMGLAIATGQCWKRLALSLPGFSPIPGTNILHIGGRDFDEGEREMLQETGATVLDSASIESRGMRAALDSVMPDFLRQVDEAHVHIDLDALNPKETPANGWLTEGGLHVDDISEAIQYIKEHLKVTSATVASFDPDYDIQGKTLQASFTLTKQILDSA